MAEVLKRMGYCLRKVVQAKPPKKIKETDAIFDNIKKRGSSPVIRRSQALEHRWSSQGEEWRFVPWRRTARRQPSG
jgi:hypothetical protein